MLGVLPLCVMHYGSYILYTNTEIVIFYLQSVQNSLWAGSRGGAADKIHGMLPGSRGEDNLPPVF
jgi:hypothetical protein